MRKYAFALVALLLFSIDCFGQAIVTPRRHKSNDAQTSAAPSQQSPALPSALPVSAIKIRASIDGRVATVRVEHLFRNDTDEALEGTYYFPVPEGATLLEFAVYDGDERRVGRVKEKEEARAAYSAAVAQGEDPAVLEMTKRGWFQSHIYPIPPRADKRIEIIYSQVLSDKDDVTTFDYPLGQGYKKLKVPVGSVEIQIDLRSDVAIKNVFSPTHPLEIENDGDRHAALKTRTVGGGDAENFKLVYQLSNEEISASLVTYRKKGEDGYFLLMLSPKIEFDKRRISAKDVIFVIDVSGSMEGDKILQAKEALRFGLTRTLNENDSFNIVAFESNAHPMSRGLVPVTRASIERALSFIDKLKADGGTNINDALVSAMKMFAGGEHPHIIVFVTDGQGNDPPDQTLVKVREVNNVRARLFTFGVGADVNQVFLEQLAAQNKGAFSNIADQSQLNLMLSTFFSKVSQPVLSDLRVDFGPVSVDRVQPAELPDLYTRSQIRIFGRYSNQEDLENVTVALTGRMNEQYQRFDFGGLHFPLFTTDKDFLPKLWATERVGALLAEIRVSGERPELKQEVIDLAHEFNLVTPYTSMYVPTTAELAREKEQAMKTAPGAGLTLVEQLGLADKADRAKATNGPGAGGGIGSGSGSGVGPGQGYNTGGAPQTSITARSVASLPSNGRTSQQNAQLSPGAVVDANGAAIPNATVTVKDENTGAERRVTTDEAGNYNVAGLPPGKYKVEVDAPGFKKTTVNNVTIQPGQTTATGIALEPGTVSEVVEVTAGPLPIIDRSVSHISSSQDSGKLKDLPSLAPVDSLARLGAGVSETAKQRVAAIDDREFRLRINGLPLRSDVHLLDGNDNNDIDGQPAIRINNFDAIETLHLLTTRGSGDVSQTGAASINVITRSGTNEFHGSLFDYHLNRRLGALSPLERRSGLTREPKFRNDIFGGALGGPIIRDRAFFFGSFARETEDSRRFVDSSSFQITPTARGLDTLARAFPHSQTVNDLITRGPLARSIGDPRVARSFSIPVFGIPVEFGEITRTVPSSASGYEGGARFDFVLTNRDRIQTSYWYDSRRATNAVGRLASGYAGDETNRAQLASAQWARTLSPRTTNELRFAFNRARASLGSNLLNDLSTPSLSIGLQGLGYGNDPLLPASHVSTLFQISEGLTQVNGRHTAKLGGQFNARLTGVEYLPGLGGHFNFASFEDFVIDNPVALVVASGDSHARFTELLSHIYIDDSWRARSNLTLTLGLSYENANQPVNQLIDRVRTREANPAAALFDSRLPVEARAPAKVDRDNNNIAPRLGLAYSPRFKVLGKNIFGADRTVIRGGVSVSYDRTPYRLLADAAASAPSVLLAALTPANVGLLPAFPRVPDANELRALIGGDPRAFARTVIERDFFTPYSIAWHLDVNRDFDDRLDIGIAYVGTRGAGLVRAIDGNPFGGASGPLRVYESSGHSVYHSLQARAELWLTNRLVGGVSYTFSKLIDDVPDNDSQLAGGIGNPTMLVAPSLQAFAQNPFDTTRGERALSSLDRRHALAAHIVWDLPLRHTQDGLMGKLLAGWKASGIIEAASGLPFTPLQYFGDRSSAALFSSIFSGRLGALRPFAGNASAPVDRVAFSNAANAALRLFLNAGGSPFQSPTGFIIADRAGFRAGQITDARFIYNDFAFGNAFAAGRAFGDVGRNTLRGPRLANIDFALLKNTKLSEKVSLQVRGEFFNLFNHPNRAIANFIVENAGGFGFADTGETDAAPRRVRVALKLIF
ncbi:MAG TPA: VIT domain-containing protein [Blastocatellia bacterium]|nr:VIT domain-containing protein [Blastocatellia bacterium]